MVIAAKFESSGQPGGTRGAPRRTLRFETIGARDSGDVHAVRVHNASSTGLLLESEAALAIGEPIDVDLPHAGVATARVVWASDAFYGCRFDEPISTATLAAAQLRSVNGPQADHTPSAALETFGSRLQRLRKERGLTLAQLGERLDVSKPTVWAWEKGKARPIESRIAAIADALSVPQEELADVHDNAETREVLAQSREAIARAYGTEPGKIRIMIEL